MRHAPNARRHARLYACLHACLLAGLIAAPARAADSSVASDRLITVLESPKLAVVVLPVPLVALAAGFGYEGFAIGPTRHEAKLLGGYFWSRNLYYDPASPAVRELDTPEGRWTQANTWQLRGSWGWRAWPGATLFVDGLGIAGGPAGTGGYDDALTGGLSAWAGPTLQLSSFDQPAFPMRGSQLRAGWAPGYHWGPTAFAFERWTLDLAHAMPIGDRATLAVRALGLWGGPQLAWVDKFQAGGGSFLRGFQWNRFTGDRLAVGTVEYRHVVEPDLLGRLGLAGAPVKVGVASTTFVDVGRAWEARSGVGVPFPNDVRIGGGTGLVGLVDGVPAGRIELNVSPEGFFPVASSGASF